jgi:hypothetical protein
MEALGTCFRRIEAESGVESFGESISLAILLKVANPNPNPKVLWWRRSLL